ncbi:hypothetical protein [Fluviicola sp.]|uniref:hypothetical protein n=1 Tax=Fluviicola sp. TaxID=1917219 RepID=UPI002629FAFE|nr:hypothetical protein [Fluviicola sp.]
MRYVLIVCACFFFFSCKKQRVIDRLEGKWSYTKILKNDGSYETHTEVYEFLGGGKEESGLPFVVYGQDTVHGTYHVPKKSIIQIKNDLTNKQIDWLVEDMDKNSLVVRVAEGVMFLDKK